MAGSGAKKRKQQNEGEIKKLVIALASINALYFIYRVWYHSDSFTFGNWVLWFIVMAMEGVALYLIKLMAQPTYNEQGELIDGGSDLSMKGLCEYYFDTIYICLIVQLLGLISDKFFYFILVIPAAIAYFGWSKIAPFIFPPKEADKEMTATEQAALKKKQEKQERKQNKVKFVRR
ncbi:transmembrane protein [Cavenderia fasciculata]|uniref:Transmembrane protein n=1 Tax=Cavenderia fasciculata TaxID=261658 RepID=F4Q6Z5_CACFS|nr:uncharacterized protein DFA_09205 [Cavenderia fasciculata]EGG16177.1 transmembrane protein [Cavenderia fasciculata]|eukprot:XP_004354561.1 transmembrane protein [Cavenderia fasciculata]